jgi:hypothetical protein
MKNLFNNTVTSITKINKTHLQFVLMMLTLMMLTLVMLVLGAGAPEEIGGVGR